MTTFPSTISARASYQRDTGRPAGSISWTRQVKRLPSDADQWGSKRVASQINQPATAISTTAHTTVIGEQHRPPRSIAAFIVLVAAALAACSGGGSKPAAPSMTATTPAPTTVAPTTSTRATGPADLGVPAVATAQGTSALGTGDLDPVIRDQVAAALRTYLNAASGTPLGSGAPAVLDNVLTPAAMARLTPETRDALVDEGLSALAAVKVDHADVALDAFMGPDTAMVVNAAVDLQLSASTPSGAPVTIVRRGTLTFVPDGGTWKIDAFDLSVARDLP
ncbi:MAG TPA: hypothetical protein VKD67_06885 [Acidimicrobiales bacterium]|nr:hypothetical protein [Acidimicrobiales bacterium]